MTQETNSNKIQFGYHNKGVKKIQFGSDTGYRFTSKPQHWILADAGRTRPVEYSFTKCMYGAELLSVETEILRFSYCVLRFASQLNTRYNLREWKTLSTCFLSFSLNLLMFILFL